jgi:glycosyltransferase involved in cell wall biosynthesis
VRTRLRGLLARTLERPDLAIAHEFRPPPYGGSNQFLLALRGELRRRGLRVGANVVTRRTRACLLNAHAFDERRLRPMLHPGCRVVHRVDGPLAAYRGFDDGTDRRIGALNAELAHATVFQSRYSVEASAQIGLEFRDPVVIPNAVDPVLFHPPAARLPLAGRKVRLITTSWSDNPNKGGEAYCRIERLLDWSRFEWTFVGRIRVPLKKIRVVAPLGSDEVASLLREHDVFVSASLNDPASNALLEALACGLPALHAASGGHAEIAGDAGFAFSDPEEVPSLLERLVDELEERRRLIAIPSLADVTDRYLAVLGLEPLE